MTFFRATEGIDTNSMTQVAKALVPALDDPKKGEYLEYRACQFTQWEAMALAHVTHTQLKQWRRDDQTFVIWETKRLSDLQSHTAKLLTYGRFMRNLHLVLKVDGEVLQKKAEHPDKLTPDERIWAASAANRYRATDLAMMEKVLNPGDYTDEAMGGRGPVTINVQINGSDYENAMAQVAGAKSLLEQFTKNRNVIEGEAREVVEGEVMR